MRRHSGPYIRYGWHIGTCWPSLDREEICRAQFGPDSQWLLSSPARATTNPYHQSFQRPLLMAFRSAERAARWSLASKVNLASQTTSKHWRSSRLFTVKPVFATVLTGATGRITKSPQE